MITSILNDVLLLRDKPIQEFHDYFTNTNIKVFDPILKSEINPEEAKQKILFILCAYSEDSPLIAIRRDSSVEKEGICDYLGITGSLRTKLVDLEDMTLRRVITQYIVEYAGPVFRSYCFLRIQYDDYELQITNKAFTIKTEKEGNVTEEKFDIKEHGKAVQEMARIASKLREIEQQIRNEVAYTKIAELRDFKSAKLEKKIAASKDQVCVEGSPLIRTGLVLAKQQEN